MLIYISTSNKQINYVKDMGHSGQVLLFNCLNIISLNQMAFEV